MELKAKDGYRSEVLRPLGADALNSLMSLYQPLVGCAGAALYLPGYYFDLLFTVSAILAGAMFLLLAAGEGVKTLEGKAALAALLLQLVYFFPGVPQKLPADDARGAQKQHRGQQIPGHPRQAPGQVKIAVV
mgnify:CR=1 FL=1